MLLIILNFNSTSLRNALRNQSQMLYRLWIAKLTRLTDANKVMINAYEIESNWENNFRKGRNRGD